MYRPIKTLDDARANCAIARSRMQRAALFSQARADAKADLLRWEAAAATLAVRAEATRAGLVAA